MTWDRLPLARRDCLTSASKPSVRGAFSLPNSLSTFTRCAQLADDGMQLGQIAFLLRRGPSLIRAYLDLLAECRRDRNRGYHLKELLRIGSCGGEKKIPRGRSAHE